MRTLPGSMHACIAASLQWAASIYVIGHRTVCASFVLHAINDVVYEHVLVFHNSSSKDVDII